MSDWNVGVVIHRDPGWCHEFVSKVLGLTSYCPVCGMIWAWWLDAWVDPAADADGVVRRLPLRDRHPTPVKHRDSTAGGEAWVWRGPR